ncbi:hypothetical protein HMPREF3038_00980 [Akkermansia sp. KLE1797]|nr:hypothetical protein HMPREF3038_00980 [Akkermansia sp. KLE1797]
MLQKEESRMQHRRKPGTGNPDEGRCCSLFRKVRFSSVFKGMCGFLFYGRPPSSGLNRECR